MSILFMGKMFSFPFEEEIKGEKCEKGISVHMSERTY